MKRALRKSIEHWENNLKLAKNYSLTLLDIDGSNCPLCNHVYAIGENCHKCIIAKKTGKY
jgi:hypothetical protein